MAKENRAAGPHALYSYVVGLAFWLLLLVPLLKPGVSLATVSTSFFGDRELIGLFNTARLWLGDRAYTQALVGNDGWLYFTTFNEIADYQRTNRFPRGTLADFQERLDAIDARLKSKGITFLVVIPPDKATIYPEHVPDQLKVLRGKSRLDQFVDAMRQDGTTPLLDLRPALQEAAKTQQIYYKTDLHWNVFASYIAYTQILSALSDRYPELRPHPYSDYRVSATGPSTFGMPALMGVQSIKEMFWQLHPQFNTGVHVTAIPLLDPPTQTVRFAAGPNQNLPRLLIYHDSFMPEIIRFLEPHFSTTISVFRNGDPAIWSLNWVDAVKPDIVILEFNESYLNFPDQDLPNYK